MSTWFSSFSLPNPLDDDDIDNPNSSTTRTAGVKHDLSALSQTFSHHLRGVAAFLAPPPTPSCQLSDQSPAVATSSLEPGSPSSEAIAGIKNDLVEIGGSFKSLLSSSNKAVTGISKFASSVLQFRDGVYDEDDNQELEGVQGIDEEVVGFAREVSLRPELWSDFPLSLPNDFNMSETQKEHAKTIEQLVPNFTTLRQKICSHLSNGQFWMIYFILLLPRLDESSMELLSSPEVVQARETLLQNLRNKSTMQVETSESAASNTSEVDLKVNITRGDSTSRQKDVSPKTVNTGADMQEVETRKYEESSDNEEVAPGNSAYNQKHSENVEDVSFSDLEDEDNYLPDRLSAQKLVQRPRVSSGSESNEWVGVHDVPAKAGSSTMRGKDSEGEESSDWLTVDDVDSDSLSTV